MCNQCNCLQLSPYTFIIASCSELHWPVREMRQSLPLSKHSLQQAKCCDRQAALGTFTNRQQSDFVAVMAAHWRTFHSELCAAKINNLSWEPSSYVKRLRTSHSFAVDVCYRRIHRQCFEFSGLGLLFTSVSFCLNQLALRSAVLVRTGLRGAWVWRTCVLTTCAGAELAARVGPPGHVTRWT